MWGAERAGGGRRGSCARRPGAAAQCSDREDARCAHRMPGGAGRSTGASTPSTGRRSGRLVGGDLRRRAVAAVLEKGMSARAAARLFEVSDMSVLRWVRRYRERGHLLDDPRPGRASVTEPERERIFRLLRERPDLSVRAPHRALAAEGAVFSIAVLPEAPRPPARAPPRMAPQARPAARSWRRIEGPVLSLPKGGPGASGPSIRG